MPWHIGKHESCPATKPHAVIKDDDGSVAGCHETREKAMAQVRALYANEGPAKALMEVKAEPLSVTQLDKWLAGKIPRRILVIPFGGPIPRKGAPLGVDLDNEWFDEATDLYGPYDVLRKTRARLVDFHHATFMTRPQTPAEQAMKGAVIGRVELDSEPSEEDVDGETFAGVWGEFWANVGERRRQLVKWLEEHGHQLYGSSQPFAQGVVKAANGHIDVWPVKAHTITTIPQNAYAVVPPLKAVLDSPYSAELTVDALRAFAADLGDLSSDLRTTSGRGADAAKAGRAASRASDTTIGAGWIELDRAASRLLAELRRKEDMAQ